MVALNECTEWGQVTILDLLAKYQPTPAVVIGSLFTLKFLFLQEATEIVDRVAPRLKHGNSAVSMSAVKVSFNYVFAAVTCMLGNS